MMRFFTSIVTAERAISSPSRQPRSTEIGCATGACARRGGSVWTHPEQDAVRASSPCVDVPSAPWDATLGKVC
jgi:hypothetical protein